jgi:uncharacterized protein YbjT (DUF2867 family)
MVKESGVPYTIVHSTQFLEFLPGIATSGTIGQEIHLSLAEIQPICSDDVALRMAEIVVDKPENGIVEIAGPDLFSLPELMIRYLDKIHDTRRVVVDANARYFGAKLGIRTLVPSKNARLSTTSFDTWISRSVLMPIP